MRHHRSHRRRGKNADSLRDLGLTATTNPGGANKWRPEYNEVLRGANLVIIGDNNDAGRDHVKLVTENLIGVAKCARVDLAKHWPECPDGGDISDWLESGGDAGRLAAWIEAAPEHDDDANPLLRAFAFVGDERSDFVPTLHRSADDYRMQVQRPVAQGENEMKKQANESGMQLLRNSFS